MQYAHEAVAFLGGVDGLAAAARSSGAQLSAVSHIILHAGGGGTDEGACGRVHAGGAGADEGACGRVHSGGAGGLMRGMWSCACCPPLLHPPPLLPPPPLLGCPRCCPLPHTTGLQPA